VNILDRRLGPHPLGVWLALLALIILMLAWAMQAYSLLDWDSAADLGLQNERFSGDPVERAWALESRGVAAADMLWPLPVTVVALVGLVRRRFFGLAAGLMALSVGVYFPLFFAFQRWSTYRGTVVFAVVFFVVPSLLGILGLLACRHHFTEESTVGDEA
jgi:hypothetical protein